MKYIAGINTAAAAVAACMCMGLVEEHQIDAVGAFLPILVCIILFFLNFCALGALIEIEEDEKKAAEQRAAEREARRKAKNDRHIKIRRL